ncbi:hypothetical protein [Bacillus sp. YKCMOAS1]|uniref:hypothetical protein n=1 Tax=Bacillus sp. YKCMOAS1 TaxID=2925778 RepID=UPI00253C837D|nr:hypothetical protein [Bacillus sp. YKCMOAS1]GLJ04295.1 hypothetical protein OAS1_35420 [Bacillus sp. YKCMOAS1]
MNLNFEGVLGKLLQGEYSARTIRKVHGQERKIRGIKNIPHYDLEETARKKLEEIFNAGKVYGKYARETLCALQYCSNHHHYLTDSLLIDDIVDHKRIVFNNYLIEYR